MRKKRVLNYFYTNYVLEQDSKYFDLPMETLINLIIKNLLYSKWKDMEREIYSEPKEYIQFSINQDFYSAYEEYLRDNNILNESSLIRNLLLYYASLNNFFREKLVYDDTIVKINEYIKVKKAMSFQYKGKIYTEIPCFISHFNVTGYICVHTEERSYELAAMKLL